MPPKRDKDLENQALDWVEANLQEPIDRKLPYEDVLRDGIILCNFTGRRPEQLMPWRSVLFALYYGRHGGHLENLVIIPPPEHLMNKLMPNCIKKIDTKGKSSFALMQNIERFQEAAKKYGVPVNEVFQTVDLWERKNIPQVTLCIHALGRVAQTRDDYSGPILGPKMAEKQERQFTDDQLREGRNVISLQYGSNKGASQAGLNMGKMRSIND